MESKKEMHTVLFKSDNYQLGWYDAQQTILYLEVFASWTWDDMYMMVGKMLTILQTLKHDFYTVQWFRDGGERLPGGITVPHIKRILGINYPNEQMLILVGVPRWKPYLEIAARASRIAGLQDVNKFRFVDTLEHSIALIEEHKASRTYSG